MQRGELSLYSFHILFKLIIRHALARSSTQKQIPQQYLVQYTNVFFEFVFFCFLSQVGPTVSPKVIYMFNLQRSRRFYDGPRCSVVADCDLTTGRLLGTNRLVLKQHFKSPAGGNQGDIYTCTCDHGTFVVQVMSSPRDNLTSHLHGIDTHL